MRTKCLLGFWLLCSVLSGFNPHFWDKQDPSEWTRQQMIEFTTSSPWAKQVAALLITNQSNMASSNSPHRGSGSERASAPIANAPSGSELPSLQVLVQWVSAKPMQQVLKSHLPATLNGRYVLCASGLPLSGDITEISEQTTLQIKRGEPVHPETAYQDPNDTSAVCFGFLPSTINVPDGKTAAFMMIAGPYAVKAKFNIGQMRYRGEPAF